MQWGISVSFLKKLWKDLPRGKKIQPRCHRIPDNPSQEAIGAFFNQTYVRDGVESMRAFDAYPVFVDYLGVEKNKKLLDVGCGTGFLLKVACERGVHSFGIDLCKEAVKLSSSVAPQASITIGNAEHLNFETGFFDYVTCLGTLEHFLDMQRGLREIYRVARDDARFCFLVPNSSSPIWKLSEIVGLASVDANENAYSLKEWKHLFKGNGFEIVHIHRDRWLIKWFMLKLGVGAANPLSTALVRYLPALLPLRLTGQFVFLVKKKPVVPGIRELEIEGSNKAEGISSLAIFYNHLTKFVLLRNRLKYGRFFSDGAMHRVLRIPHRESDSGVASKSAVDINDHIFQAADLPAQPKILDAGCGIGGTIFQLYEKLAGRFDGMTISPVQWRVAREEAHRRGIQDGCRFYLTDYDQPPSHNYDAVISIESLIYSADIPLTIHRWAQALKPGGKLIVVGDMLVETKGDMSTRDVENLKQHWHLFSVHSEQMFLSALQKASLKVIREKDLSSFVQKQSRWRISLLEASYRLLFILIPLAPFRSVLSAYLGALAVQRLYAQGRMRYTMFIAEKIP